METRKIVLILTVAALVMVAIGVGYAYTAMTTNTGNTAETEYLIITQTDGTQAKYSGAFNQALSFDTVTVLTDKGAGQDPRYVQEVLYEVSDGSVTQYGSTEYVMLGSVYLIVDESRSDDDYKVTTTVSGATGLDLDDYRYYVQYSVGSGASIETAKASAEGVTPDEDTGDLIGLTVTAPSTDAKAVSGTITNEEDNDYTVIIVKVFASLLGGNSYTRALDDPLNVTVLNDVVFRFTAGTV